MKQVKKITLILGSAAILVSTTGCFGSFSFTKKLYQFNKGVGDKFIQELVFIGLVILPIYEIAAIGDVIVFNLIEFWTGSNPVALKAGEKEEKLVRIGEKTYQFTATQNVMNIREVVTSGNAHSTSFVYNPNYDQWFVVTPEATVKIANGTTVLPAVN